MTTIEFSLIPDAETDYQTMLRLMKDFKRETGVDVRLKRMDWGDAWPQLIGIATNGQGADISHVGSTWVSSLMTMNALRALPSHLINKIGGEQAFVHSTWTNVVAEEDRQVYGIPLSAYVYVVAYRKDLLQQAKLNPVTAFATPAALEESVRCIEALQATETPWLMPIVPHPFNDFVHMAASWIWSSGGHVLDNRGKQVLLNSPAALAGLKSFLRLIRHVPNTDYLGSDECMNALVTGKASAVITDARALNTAIRTNAANIESIGAASLMSIPWSGGGSLVIWRHTYGYPDRLDAAYKLAEFMVRKQTMMELANSCYTLPSRTDALDELFPPDHALRPVMLQLISTGRSYRPIALWHRIEYQFGAELGQVIKKLMNDPNLDVNSTIEEAMDSLSYRLNLTLG
jgi:ABC-type glycerol-3-phosphate transport system substrate-binding protein